MSTQSTASRHPGPSHRSHRLDASCAEMSGVAIADPFERAGFDEPVLGELPDGLEQAVPRAWCGVIGDDERLAHERVEVSEDLDLVGVLDDGADGSSGRSRRQRPMPRGSRSRSSSVNRS